MNDHEKKGIYNDVRGGPDRLRYVSRAKAHLFLLLRRAVRVLAVLAGVASFALLYAPVRADTYATLYDGGSYVSQVDNGESNFTQQHQTSVRNIQFTGAPSICSVKVNGLSYSGTPTDTLTLTLYSKSSAWVNGDVTSGGSLVASTSLTAAQIISGSSTFAFSNCQGTTASYYYGLYFARSGAESDTNFYKIGHNNSSPTDIATFTAGAFADITPSPKHGAVVVYGIGSPSGYYVAIETPATGSTLNPFSRFLILAQSYTSSTIRVNYYDNYGGLWTTTSTGYIYSPDIPAEYTVGVDAVTLHNGFWTAKAYLLSTSSQILAESSFNTFTIVPSNYAQTYASTTAMLQNGIFTLDTCVSSNFFSSSTLEMISCNALNAIKSIGNTIYTNVLLMGTSVGTLLRDTFPISIFTHLYNDVTQVSCSSSTAPIVVPFNGQNLTLIGANSIQSAASSTGFANFRDFADKLIYLFLTLGVIAMAVLAVGVVHNSNQQ